MDKTEKDLLRLLLLQQYMPSENPKMEVLSAKVEDSLEFYENILGSRYRCKRIGNKIWMMENLAALVTNVIGERESNTVINIESGECYYTWNDAMKVSKNARNGWHLPSSEEWNQLALDLGGRDSGGYDNPNLKDFFFDDEIISKMNIKLSGNYDGSFDGLGFYSYFWTSVEYSSNNAYYRYLDTGTSLNSNSDYKTYGLSIRLVKDS